jgi:hypothetical protein
MTNFDKCRLKLDFKFGKTNSDYMNLLVIHREKQYNVSPDSNDCASVDLNLNLPDVVVLIVSNKNINDTIVDSEGNIVEDRYIQLQSAHIDGFELNYNFLHKKVVLNTTNNSVVSSYFGFNGFVNLIFDQENVFYQIYTLNRET